MKYPACLIFGSDRSPRSQDVLFLCVGLSGKLCSRALYKSSRERWTNSQFKIQSTYFSVTRESSMHKMLNWPSDQVHALLSSNAGPPGLCWYKNLMLWHDFKTLRTYVDIFKILISFELIYIISSLMSFMHLRFWSNIRDPVYLCQLHPYQA